MVSPLSCSVTIRQHLLSAIVHSNLFNMVLGKHSGNRKQTPLVKRRVGRHHIKLFLWKMMLWCFVRIPQDRTELERLGSDSAENFDIVWWQYSSIFLPRRNSIKRTYLFVWNHDQRDCEADEHKKEELFRIAFSHAVGCSHWSWSCPNGGYNGHGNVYTLPRLRWASIQPLCLSRMSLAGTSSVLPRWST